MAVERAWGSYLVIDAGLAYQAKRLEFLAGATMNKQHHAGRDETWTVVGGYGTLIVDGRSNVLSVGETYKVMRGQWHSFHAGPFGCKVIETWHGLIDEGDIERG